MAGWVRAKSPVFSTFPPPGWEGWEECRPSSTTMKNFCARHRKRGGGVRDREKKLLVSISTTTQHSATYLPIRCALHEQPSCRLCIPRSQRKTCVLVVLLAARCDRCMYIDICTPQKPTPIPLIDDASDDAVSERYTRGDDVCEGWYPLPPPSTPSDSAAAAAASGSSDTVRGWLGYGSCILKTEPCDMPDDAETSLLVDAEKERCCRVAVGICTVCTVWTRPPPPPPAPPTPGPAWLCPCNGRTAGAAINAGDFVGSGERRPPVAVCSALSLHAEELLAGARRGGGRAHGAAPSSGGEGEGEGSGDASRRCGCCESPTPESDVRCEATAACSVFSSSGSAKLL